MSRNSVSRDRAFDKLDRVLLAGYTFNLDLTPSRELVRVMIVKPDGAKFNDVYGPVVEGALSVLDRAVTIADEHRAELYNQRSPGEDDNG